MHPTQVQQGVTQTRAVGRFQILVGLDYNNPRILVGLQQEFPVCLFNVKVSEANGDLSNADLLTSSRLAPSQALSKNKQG